MKVNQQDILITGDYRRGPKNSIQENPEGEWLQ